MKNGTIWLMLGAFLFFCTSGAPIAHAASASNNGMTYILLPPTNSDPAYIVRLQHQDPSGVTTPQAQLYAPGSSGYPAGQYFGLAVSQEREIFLLRSPILGADDGWATAPVGFLPNPNDYPANSDIFIRMAAPSTYGSWTAVHGLDGAGTSYSFWDKDVTINGVSYDWAVYAGGPAAVHYLDPLSTAIEGTPIWNGSAGNPHPTDPDTYGYILPSHWGGVGYYAYGTKEHPNFPWKALDGREDPVGSGIYRPRVLVTEVPTYHGSDNQKFSCIVKRVYQKRDRSLTLMRGTDNPFSALTDQTGAVLSATDIRGMEYFARACGDNCIPGGSGPGTPIDSALARVTVVTSTLGRRYGFNQKGKMASPYSDSKQAALRVVSTAGESTIDMANSDDTVHSNITNAAYLNGNGIKASEIRSFGVSSNFETGATRDFIYGSKADLFAMQDSWWGKGGIGYEYYKDTGEIYKLDYTNNTNPSPEYLGILTGKIDNIGVDGDGFLYIMTTEKDTSDAAVFALAPPTNSVIGNPDYLVKPSATQWYRPVYEAPPIVVSDASKVGNDYREIIYFQGISKVVRKYPPSAGNGSLAAPVTTGQLSGYYADEWTRKICWNGSEAAWEGSWSLENPASRDSEIPGELAVVNIAKLPAVFNETPAGPHICREDRTPFETPVTEDTSVKFKVEGYKPYITDGDGTTRRNLKSLGSFGSAYTNVRINYLPTAEGEYNHYEDPDIASSGFPTSLFEADGYPTTIVWYADLVDGTDTSASVLESIAVASASTDTFGGTACDWKFIPPHPGNYAIWARITYNYFNFAGADRPTDLTSSQRTVSTSKRILTVVSPSSKIVPPSLISEISLEPERGESKVFQNCTTYGDAVYDLPEDEKIGSLSISFKAQFLCDANYRSNQSLKLTTYEGIGVWDYDTYYINYNNSGETPNYTLQGIHVYNYDPSASSYTNTNIFNPGWPKPGNPGPADAGTRVDSGTLSQNDLKFLRWNLLLEKTYTGSTFPSDPKDRRDVNLASGDFTIVGGATIQPTGTLGEYEISLDLPPSAQTAVIATPIDPDQYTLRLELIYPRVTWYESGSSDAEKQYRSIISDPASVSVVCELDHPIFPTRNTLADGSSAFKSVQSWLIRSRDATLPTITDDTKPIIHTTGDPVPDALASFTISDNNPRARFDPFFIEYQMVNSARPRDTAETNKTLNATDTSNSGIASSPDYVDFWKNNSYKISATYKSKITEYGPDGDFSPDGLLKNWVGVLYYHVKGSLYDGLGTDSSNITHEFGSFTADIPAESITTTDWALNRFDNDPPGFRVELISQNDNRRWVATLTEGVKDLVCRPTTDAGLAPASLSVACYNLDGTMIGGAPTMSSVPGCAQYPTQLGAANETVNAGSFGLDSALMPRVRRSSRLLINLDIIDNVDYINLKAATFDIIENLEAGGTRSLLPGGNPVSLPLDAAFLADNSPNPKLQSPRARYTVDMPMKVLPNQPQVSMTISATDAQGNIRTLVLPIEIVDSSFDARVLESKENRN